MSWLETAVTAGPGAEPLALDQAKAQCRVDPSVTDDDGLITGLISAARQHVELYCNVRLLTQTVAMRCAVWDDLKRFPDGPLQSITTIGYVDSDGVAQTLDQSVYSPMLYGLSPGVRLAYNQSWPNSLLSAADAITVTAIAGYGDAATDVPQPLLQAMLLMISQWYDAREDYEPGYRLVTLPNASDALLANFRRAAI